VSRAAGTEATASAQPLDGKPAARVLIAGASGYAGALAAELTWKHPQLELVGITARTDAGKALSDLYPGHAVPLVLEEPSEESADGVDAAIVAYPHGAAAPVVASFRRAGVMVVDLSADFRLHDLETYGRWYGEHGAPELLDEAVYGLTELHRERIADAGLVANPGCYPTASLLALAPLAEAGLIEDVVIDAKSGVSGAGRAAAGEMEAVTEGDDTRPYKVAGHRHAPEIAQELAGLAGASTGRVAPSGAPSDNGLTFVPHLMPYHQGELVSCYARTSEPLDAARVLELYETRFADEPFVELSAEPPGVAGVRETNLCRIHVALDEGSGRVMSFAAIDNLWKGAASQAIQNLNLMLGLSEGEGIS
jgi:N-acetyl-gamma-glutamyl-phosphate reductase